MIQPLRDLRKVCPTYKKIVPCLKDDANLNLISIPLLRYPDAVGSCRSFQRHGFGIRLVNGVYSCSHQDGKTTLPS